MIDREFELELRAWYSADVPISEMAPATLRASVAAIPRTVVRPVVMGTSRRRIVLLAAAAMVGVTLGALLIGGPGEQSTPPPSARATLESTLPTSLRPASAWRAVGDLGEDCTRAALSTASLGVLLQDGRVLAACGDAKAAGGGSAELYDPVSETWTMTAPMSTPRAGHTVTLLSDGRVLVAGGLEHGALRPATLSSAEIYDPTTETWSPTGALHAVRANHTATLLPDGRVLVAGGDGPETCVVDACTWPDTAPAELYDPRSGVWTLPQPMPNSIYNQAATLLHDGRVLVVGGGNLVGWRTSEIFDPAGEAWSQTGDMIQMRAGPSLILLPTGQVLVLGGELRDYLADPFHEGELYDPDTGRWRLVDSASFSIFGGTATLLGSGKILVVWGAGARLYDPAADTWLTVAGALPRYQHTAVSLEDGTVLVFGGQDENYTALRSAQVFDPSAVP